MFTSIVCPRSGRPIKVASKKRAIRLLVNAQRELIRDNQKTDVPDDIDSPTRIGHQMRSKKHPPAPYVTMIGQTYLPDRQPSCELIGADFDKCREVIAQRLIQA